MLKLLFKYRLIFSILSNLFLLNFPTFIFGQSNIEFQVEGKQFKNSELGLSIQYGYISQWNTYGITFTNKNSAKFYFINCSKNISSDGNSMILSQCRNLNDESAGTIYIYPNRIIQSYPDGRIVFELVESSDEFDGLEQLLKNEEKKHGIETQYFSESFNQVYDKDVWRNRKNDFYYKRMNFGDGTPSQEVRIRKIYDWYDRYIEKAKPVLSEKKATGNISIGQNSIRRDPDNRKDFANVFYNSSYTLFDMWSDEPIFPSADGMYNIFYATNEDKTPRQIKVSPRELEGMTVYKFKNYSNCNNWCKGIAYKEK